MATDRVGILTTDDFNVAANWLPAAVPIDNDNILLNDQAQGPLLNGLVQAAKDFGIVRVSAGFNFSVGGATNFFTPVSINDLYFASSGQNFYVDATILRIHCNSSGQSETALVVAGTITEVTVVKGKMQFASTATLAANSRIVVNESAGGISKLTIPAGVTIPGTNTIVIDGGEILASAGINDLQGHGGAFRLQSSAAVTGTIEWSGGDFHWESDGTITKANVRGGNFLSMKNDRPKTLTDMTIYGNAIVDLSRSANITFTNPIRIMSPTARLLLPPGATVAVLTGTDAV